MLKLINYANNKYKVAQRVNSWTGRHIAHFDEVLSFGPNDIEPDFWESHKDILSQERGNGLWLWKPYFINRVINDSKDGDYIFYLDSGSFFIRDVHILLPYISEVNPLFVTDIPLMECNWTKPACFDFLHAEQYHLTNQIQGGILFFLVNATTRAFFRDYLNICKDTKLLYPGGLGKGEPILKNYGEQFVAHREDQSIFSLMCKKRGIKAHRDITQRGKDPRSFYNPNYLYQEPEHPDDCYPTIAFLHKAPNPFNPVVWARLIKNKLFR